MLVLVVGPSGAGKDTLLDAARRTLEGDTRFRFVRRIITRPFDGGVEAHEPADEAGFEARRNAGAFGLFWRAHGFAYGIPADIGIDLEQGRVVVANVSRAVIAEAASRYRVKVIEITAPAEVLARRLAARGREDAVSAASRLARSVPVPASVEKETIMNDGTVEQGAKRLAGALTRAAEAVLQS
jgi:phosphonate metabolism protein PhnN/1,5-bisphosphokinase (PRPP-forming)